MPVPVQVSQVIQQTVPVQVKAIGTRLGEKLVESLISEEETRFVQETDDMDTAAGQADQLLAEQD